MSPPSGERSFRPVQVELAMRGGYEVSKNFPERQRDGRANWPSEIQISSMMRREEEHQCSL